MSNAVFKGNCGNWHCDTVHFSSFEGLLGIYEQGRRQDFVKGGADARREMPTPLQSEVWGLPGVWGLPEAYDHMFLE